MEDLVSGEGSRSRWLQVVLAGQGKGQGHEQRFGKLAEESDDLMSAIGKKKNNK